MYSADLSLFVLDAGIALLERGMAPLLYLSLSDYVQHAHAPARPRPMPSTGRSMTGCGALSNWAPSSVSSPTTA